MTCSLLHRHVDAWIDEELDPAQQLHFEEHISVCSDCEKVLLSTESFRTSFVTHIERVQASDDLRLRIQESLEKQAAELEEAAREPVSLLRFPARYWLAAAACLVVFAGMQHSRSDNATQQAGIIPIFEDVGRLHSSGLPADVQGNADELLGFFRNRIEFPVRPVEFAHSDARLIAGRLSNIRDRHAAALYYKVNGHRVTVVVFDPQRAVSDGSIRAGIAGRDVYYRHVHGYTIAVLQHDGLTYAFTGDLAPQALLQLAASARVQY